MCIWSKIRNIRYGSSIETNLGIVKNVSITVLKIFICRLGVFIQNMEFIFLILEIYFI